MNRNTISGSHWSQVDTPVKIILNQQPEWYNMQHYHSRVGYVTPIQKHTGQAERIIAERKIQLTAQREHRKQYGCHKPLIGDGL